MMSKLENPPLLVVAGMRFHHPFGLFFFFGPRWRRFSRALKGAPGLLLYQQLVARPQRFPWPDTFLALTWWESRQALKDWYNHPEHQRMIRWVEEERTGFDLWIEEYILREPGQYRGLAGGLKEVLERKGLALR